MPVTGILADGATIVLHLGLALAAVLASLYAIGRAAGLADTLRRDVEATGKLGLRAQATSEICGSQTKRTTGARSNRTWGGKPRRVPAPARRCRPTPVLDKPHHFANQTAALVSPCE